MAKSKGVDFVKLFIRIGFAAIALLAVFLTINIVREFHPDVETPSISIKPDNTYSKTLIVVADMDYSPYSFTDENGLPSGHDVELVYALANQMKVNVDLRLTDWKGANKQILNGEADIILGMVYNPQLQSSFDLTIPLNNDPFVAFSKGKNNARIDLFYSARLAALDGGIVNDAFIAPYNLTGGTTLYKTYNEAFQSVANGENDYVIAPFSVGRRSVAAGGFAELAADGPVLFNGTNCIAVTRGNTELLAQLNKNLLVLLDNGTVDVLKDRWLGEYVKVITLSEYLTSRFYLVLLLIALFVTIALSVFAYIYYNQRMAKNKAILNEKCFKVLAEQTNKVIFEWDFATNKIVSMSNFSALFGREPASQTAADEAISVKMVHHEDTVTFQNTFETMLQGKNIDDVKFRIRDAGGVYYWCMLSGVVISDDEGKPYRAIGSLENINDRVIKEESLRQKAEKDQLTGLFNKMTTENIIKQELRGYDDVNECSALLIIDVDNFKNINDTLGHLSGDIVLSSLADKLKMAFRTNDIIGRIGGDEFFVFMKNVISSDIVTAKAKEINRAFRNTYRENAASCTISASIGIAFFPAHGSDLNTLYKNADTALYITKERGKDGFTIYNGQLRGDYPSARTEIDVRGNVPQKSFKENRIEYLFKLLYGERDTHAIQSALELVTDHFGFSRGYIFEINNDEQTTSNTYEWCKEDISPEILNLQKIPLAEVPMTIGHLVDNGKFIMRSLDDVPESERAILEPQGIKSMFHFGIFAKGKLVGFVGFDDCAHERTPTSSEIDELSTICNLISVFV